MGFSFGGAYIIFASTHTLYIVVSEKISEMGDSVLGERTSFLRPHIHSKQWSAKKYRRWGIQFWGSVHHFCVHTYTLHSGPRKNIGDGGFSYGGAYIIFASTHTLY